MISPRFYNYLAWLLLLLFLLVGGYLRTVVWWANPLEGDQSILISIAMRFINRGWEAFPLAANKSSAGMMNPPLIEYLYILPLLITPSLRALHWFQAGLSLAAVVLLYGYAASLFGRRVALLAALFFVVAPWAVYYGRFIWNPNPIPLFSTLLLMSLLAVLAAGRSPLHLVGALVGLTAVTQLHLSGLVLIMVTGLALILFWPQWLRPTAWPGLAALVGGGLLALLLYYPFFIFQRAVGFQDLQLMQAALLGGGEAVGQAQLNSAALLLHWDLASGHGYAEAVGMAEQLPSLWRLLPYLMQALMALALAYILLHPLITIWRQKKLPHQLSLRQKSCLILVLWVTVPILLYWRHTVYLQNYYFLYFYPVPFLALALMVDEVWQWAQPRWGRAAWLLFLPLVLLAGGQFYLSQARAQYLQAGQNLPGRTVAQVESAINAGRQALNDYPHCDFIIVGEGGTPETASLGLLEDFLYPASVRFIDSGRGYIEPADCALYLNATADERVANWLQATAVPLSYAAQIGQATVPFYRVAGHQMAGLPGRPAAAWQNGLALLDSHLTGEIASQANLTLTYEWLVTEADNGRLHYHFFNHLVNEAGELVAQEDAPAINALYWQNGDRLVTQFHLILPTELPPGSYRLLLGLYSWPDLQRVQLTTGGDIFQVTTWTVPE
jgi:hypothetical protein